MSDSEVQIDPRTVRIKTFVKAVDPQHRTVTQIQMKQIELTKSFIYDGFK